MKEIWKPIKGFKNYLVSNTGKIFSKNVNREVILEVSNRGYLRFALVNKSKKKLKNQYIDM